MEAIMKVGPKGQVVIPQDAVAIFRKTAKGKFWKSLELIKEYNLLPRDGIHAATAFIAGAETIFSEDPDFDDIKGLKRKWINEQL